MKRYWSLHLNSSGLHDIHRAGLRHLEIVENIPFTILWITDSSLIGLSRADSLLVFLIFVGDSVAKHSCLPLQIIKTNSNEPQSSQSKMRKAGEVRGIRPGIVHRLFGNGFSSIVFSHLSRCSLWLETLCLPQRTFKTNSN